MRMRIRIRAWYRHDTPKLKFVMKEVKDDIMFVMEKDNSFQYPLSVILQDEDWIKELWTGLTDIHGIDIYEDDVVIRPNDDNKYVVIECRGKHWLCNDDYMMPLTDKCVVIGNIEENPHILEEK